MSKLAIILGGGVGTCRYNMNSTIAKHSLVAKQVRTRASTGKSVAVRGKEYLG